MGKRDRIADLLADREFDHTSGPVEISGLDNDLRAELAACTGLERELSALSMSARGHPENTGDWILLRPLGQGYSGTVYLGERGDGVRAAVRTLWGPFPFPILETARSARGWTHTGAAAVLEVGMDWIASELTGGVPLSRALAALRRNPPRDRQGVAQPLLRAMGPVAGAIVDAHERNLIHTGISPRKLDLSRTGEMTIRDFGFDPTRGGRPPSPVFPPLGATLFLAPEQSTAETELTSATDAWSLAAVAWTVATGVPPFVARSLDRLLALIRKAEPRPVRDLAPWLPEDVATTIDSALTASPGDRPSVAELAGGLLLLDGS